MKISALLRLLLLQPLLANGARHYSPDTPMVIVADVCGTNPKDLSQAYRARLVAKLRYGDPQCAFLTISQLHCVCYNKRYCKITKTNA